MNAGKENALLQLDILTSNASAQKVSDNPNVQMQHVAGTVAMYQNLRSVILKVPDDAFDEATEGGEGEAEPTPKSEEPPDDGGTGDPENT